VFAYAATDRGLSIRGGGLKMHEAALCEWGAVPEEILYDRMKTVVTSRRPLENVCFRVGGQQTSFASVQNHFKTADQFRILSSFRSDDVLAKYSP
jgi:hypothetical protein